MQKHDSRHHSTCCEAKGALLWWTGKKRIGLRLQCQFESRFCFLPFWCLNFVACCVIYWACKMNILQLKNLHVPVCTLRISQKGGFRNWGKKGFMNSANFFLWVLFFFLILEWRLRITYTIRYNLMHYTIKSICCSLCISIPMLSLSIFPSLPLRAVEVLSCDITPRRGKSEQPCTLLYTTGKQSEDLLWSQM